MRLAVWSLFVAEVVAVFQQSFNSEKNDPLLLGVARGHAVAVSDYLPQDAGKMPLERARLVWSERDNRAETILGICWHGLSPLRFQRRRAASYRSLPTSPHAAQV